MLKEEKNGIKKVFSENQRRQKGEREWDLGERGERIKKYKLVVTK